MASDLSLAFLNGTIAYMQIFGLLSLLVTVGLIGWWFTSSVGPVQNEDGTIDETTYEEAINNAKDVAGQIEARSDTLNNPSGKSITVYDGINVPESSTVLDLSGRNLSGSLKAEIRHLGNLKELNVSNNNFTGLPAEVGQLAKLEVLNLSNNPFTGLPQELGNLKNLQVLDLRGTQYSEFDLNIIKGNLPTGTEIMTD